MKDYIYSNDLSQVKLSLSILKTKISLLQNFLTQAQDEIYKIQEIIFDEEDRAIEKIKIYINHL